MGEREAKKADFPVKLLPMKIAKETTAQDTKTAVDLLAASSVDLIVFVGGDGTARDVFDAMQGCRQVPVIGVPAGVKMYSGIFAVSPSDAVEVVLSYARGLARIIELEIVDADEKAVRSNVFALKIHGFLQKAMMKLKIKKQ
jgi:predicted polyphosphate/ATP-dependent NAD kinase